ncbi:hypothetical protein, partial [Xanthomonas oryzae]|uniref:hypothetical protein n=1 Tax=Xanthomonas oryzae TaxID=347 RepID=UPI0011BFB340
MLNRTLEVRFEQDGEVVAAALSHADRKQPAHWYLKLRYPHVFKAPMSSARALRRAARASVLA